MKVGIFSAKPYDRKFFDEANKKYKHDLKYFKVHLTNETAKIAGEFPVVCPFVNDNLDREVLSELAKNKTKLIALRSAGFNNVDLTAAKELGLKVMRVPAYSPHSVAEHTVGLMLALNRKIHRAYARVREGNFELDGLLGFDIYGRTVGIIGTGKIGIEVAKILKGFGCNLLGYDIKKNKECEKLGLKYVELEELFSKSDIVTLHCPLTPETHHLIDKKTLEQMKDCVMLINTGRGALIDTHAVIDYLKSGKIAYLGLDVYEEEEELFFEDLSNKVIQDDTFARLTLFPNVIITGHQAFFTTEALKEIANTTLNNVADFEKGKTSGNIVTEELIKK